MPDEDLVAIARMLEPLVEVRPAASETEIAEAQSALGVDLPAQLRAFLLASNGASIAVKLDKGEFISGASPLVWSLNELVAENRKASRFRTAGSPALYFANAGVDGILFGHPIDPAGLVLEEVVAWYPIEGRLAPVAPTFRDFLTGWLSGSIQI